MQWADLTLILVALLTLIVLFTFVGSLLVLVPYVPTPKAVAAKMVELAGLHGDETIYDLGCGDGRILIEAKRKLPGIRAIGYELPIGIYLLGRLRVALAGFAKKSQPGGRIELHMRDFFGADLRDADVLFLYLIPEVFARLEQKLQQELRPGTKIISHGFSFPGKEPEKVERCPLPSWRLFSPYGKEGPRIFVYRW
ncbi:MAG: hypothetical protein AAB853_01780 [Patescibacteria group bacterium]